MSILETALCLSWVISFSITKSLVSSPIITSVSRLVESPFCLLFTIVTALALDEFNSIVIKSGTASPNRTITVLAGSYLFLATYLYFSGRSSAGIFIPYVFSLIFILGSEVHRRSPRPLLNITCSLASQVQIAFPFVLLNLLTDKEGSFSGLFPLAIFIFLWVNDTGAYLTGSLLHKRFPYQLAPSISPNKTWIGSIGGVVICLAAGAAIAAITHTYSVLLWMGMALTAAISGTYGDLIESMIKRQLGIKDSGSFLPGHGGVLDRFDSSLLAIPACTVYLYLSGCLA